MYGNLPDPTAQRAPAGGGSGAGWGTALGGLLALGGAYLGYKGQKSANATNISIMREQNAFSAEQAARQMAFQREMSSTSYQRGVEDMEKAGVNPYLAYSQGGASTPGGASGSGSGARVENEAGAMLGTASAVAQVLQGFQNISQSKAQEELILATAAKTREETLGNAFHTALMQNQIGKLATSQDVDSEQADSLRQALRLSRATFSEDVARRKAESALTQMEIPKSQAEAEFWKTDFGEATPFIRALMSIFGGAASAKRIFSKGN